MGTQLQPLVSWAEVARRDPDMVTAAKALLHPAGDVAIGFLATASDAGVPHLAPVCPIFCDDWLYLSVAPGSPKRRDLDGNGRYVLHAFLGTGDAEFQVAGQAQRIDDPAQRAGVQQAIRFGAFGRADPIYRLWVERCLHVRWLDAGQPGARPVRRWFRAQAGDVPPS